MPTIYELLRDAGCEIDSHQADLYVKATPKALEVLANYNDRHESNCYKLTISLFPSAIDGTNWIEIAFAYDPWWVAKCKAN